MVHIVGDIEIGRPVDEVFEFVADARNESRYNRRMHRAEKLSPGPIAVGTRFRSELAAMGRSVEAITEITGYDPRAGLHPRLGCRPWRSGGRSRST